MNSNNAVPIHGSRIGEEIEVQIPRVRFQPQPQYKPQEQSYPEPQAPVTPVERPMRIRDRIRDPAMFRLCDDKECVGVHIFPLSSVRENYSSSSSSGNIMLYIVLAILVLVIVYMSFNNIYPFRFFENLMFF